MTESKEKPKNTKNTTFGGAGDPYGIIQSRNDIPTDVNFVEGGYDPTRAIENRTLQKATEGYDPVNMIDTANQPKPDVIMFNPVTKKITTLDGQEVKQD